MTFSRVDLWKTLILKLYKRVAELIAENTFTDKESVQQILVNAARGELRKKGTMCLISRFLSPVTLNCKFDFEGEL